MMTAETLFDATLAEVARRQVNPRATYRVQMHAGFTLQDLRSAVPYLDRLGVSHVYLSPILKARPGSTHGYDVIDPTTINPEIGTIDDLTALVADLRSRGMGVILDVVPNHMAVSPDNPWWRDVFEHGPSSPYAGYFDIAWDDPPRPDLRGRVMLPILGAPYHQILESGELELICQNGAFLLRYHGTTLPLGPRSYRSILAPCLDRLGSDPTTNPAALSELHSILIALDNMPDVTVTDPEAVRVRRVETEVIKRRIGSLIEADPAVAAAIDAERDKYHCRPDCAESCARLDALLDEQAYRLCFWRVASDEINYRRFFDVNELSALSAEREDVFRQTHQLILDLCGQGLIDGLRIDHPDGLFDPRGYLERLQVGYLLAVARHLASADPTQDDWSGMEQTLREQFEGWLRNQAGRPLLYVVVEKILEGQEKLPPDWLTAGTTGYEFLNAIHGIFVDPRGEAALTQGYEDFTGRDESFVEVAYRQKMLVLQSSFASELGMLAQQLDRLARKNRRARDFTLNGLRRALRAVIASFPVYRSYVTSATTTADERMVIRAVRDARRRTPTLSPELFTFIRDTILLKPPAPGTTVAEDYAQEQARFAGKFQQVTAPVTAKGIEDTACYRYHRLVSLNEVGGDPGRFGWRPRDLHAFLAERQERWPTALSTTATHDTKRGEDTRVRISAISELADEWITLTKQWTEWNQPHRTPIDDSLFAPDLNDEYLLYQTLVGTGLDDWDRDRGMFIERIQAYMAKATHEAKEHTSWINPDEAYDQAVSDFVARILDPEQSSRFLESLRSFCRRVDRISEIPILSQALLRLLAPGVPDTYQGTEGGDRTLVDPDNRRPVDYVTLAKSLETGSLPKQHLVARALAIRTQYAELFAEGEYLPMVPEGPRAEHLFVMARRRGSEMAIVVLPRLVAELRGEEPDRWWKPGVWEGTQILLPEEGPALWANALTGAVVSVRNGSIAMADVLEGPLPVAVLVAKLGPAER